MKPYHLNCALSHPQAYKLTAILNEAMKAENKEANLLFMRLLSNIRPVVSKNIKKAL